MGAAQHRNEAEPDVLASGREGPGVRERWDALPALLRRGVLGSAALALLAAGGYAVAGQPGPSAPTRAAPPAGTETHGTGAPRHPQHPAQAARITFRGLELGDRRRRTFTIELHAAATSPLKLTRVSQNYEGLRVGLSAPGPVRVRPGGAKHVKVTARITSCDRLPLRARSPFLDVTLGNELGPFELSVIPGERYTRALTHAFRTLCGPSTADSLPNP
ncbi:hypothetical protein H181DRAFT_02315 [Streptomyces sp. WMMB 714]|uniref:hypothetical protein n=1 Tax=Streptomyces sp. WMMB 714 TaxID=1286822 RepID=UPI0005F88094|nr:hypothetical protein [Streptomyces sp. WMMB 714]SCK29428.1 hypothetical protein H181DRAFT_02315 [Streptomyces sp. WMMB 714]